MVANPNFTEMVVTTLEHRRGVIADNVLLHNALLAHLKSTGKVDPAPGGRTLVEELSYKENETAGWYDGYQLIDITPQLVHSAAEYPWRQAAASVTASGGELAMNSGRDAVIQLLKARIENAEDSMTNLIAGAIYSDGTGHGGKEIGGLAHLVPNDPTSGVAGGINRATFTFWQNAKKDASGDITSPDATKIQGHMQDVWLATVRGGDKPDIIPSGKNGFLAYWNSLLAMQRITTPSKGASGFQFLEFYGPNGSAPVIFDDRCGDDQMYFLNSKYIKFRPHKDRNMITTDKRSSTNQDAIVVLLLWMGNLTLSNAARQGVLFD